MLIAPDLTPCAPELWAENAACNTYIGQMMSNKACGGDLAGAL